MLFTEISPAGVALQLPKLEVGKMASDYYSAIEVFYEISLDPDQYEETQVYLGSDGFPHLDLAPKTPDAYHDTLQFVGRALSTNTLITVPNPMKTQSDAYLPQSPLWVVHVDELKFLSDISLNTPRDIFSPGDPIPSYLAAILNGSGGNVKWGVGSLADYSVAGFSVAYIGNKENAPSGIVYPPKAETVALIDINSGSNKGRLMVCAEQTWV